MFKKRTQNNLENIVTSSKINYDSYDNGSSQFKRFILYFNFNQSNSEVNNKIIKNVIVVEMLCKDNKYI